MKINDAEMKYLKLLSSSYPTAEDASNEIINLTAIQNLPKGTEHFLSDIHGESEAFEHILRNASGTIKIKIDENFPDMTAAERKSLATLIYYPEEKLEIIKKHTPNMGAYYKDTLYRLVTILEVITFKYTRSYVRRRMPQKHAYIIEELLYGSKLHEKGQQNYRQAIIESIIENGAADRLIADLCHMISQTAIFKLHILGDMFDRGAGGDIVVEDLMNFHSVDIQWGNHDILWMGAAAGNKACIANVIRICTRYDNLHTLEVGYGISLRPLLTFAMKVYGNDPCPNFKALSSTIDAMHDSDLDSLSKINKAIAIIQFKLEGQLIEKYPYFEMEPMRLLDKIDYEKNTVMIDGKEYALSNSFFPTVDPENPYKLTPQEDAVMNRLQKAFLESEMLQRHVRFLFAKGSIYKVVNGNLLLHGCVPLNRKGEPDRVRTPDGYMRGKEWLDYSEHLVRVGYFGKPGNRLKTRGVDFFWYLWCGYKSPLFGKKKMTTFERLFIDDESTWVEEKNPYYKNLDNEEVISKLLEEFGADGENGVMINGHMPVKKGNNPIRCGGRVLQIDGGFAKAYQKTTGIAGYSLIQNSYGFILTANEPFVSREKAIEDELDIHSHMVAKENVGDRILNKDTDDGKEMQSKIESLRLLVEAYNRGILHEELK